MHWQAGCRQRVPPFIPHALPSASAQVFQSLRDYSSESVSAPFARRTSTTSGRSYCLATCKGVTKL
jgi:hypothetical protein